MHAASETKMASAAEKKKASRKRKRPDIPGFTASAGPTPEVISQAPRGINAAEFAEARALEISNMVEAIKDADKTSGKRLFQTLPRHMRRRAMSHNVKRMPARLRYRASLEMNNPANRSAEVSKKKSRRYRRKPKNLLEEYTRRQREHVWLETHIWHAKRMKMVHAWGYKLADHPNDKGFRAAYRAVKNSCILQDISFYGCIEVSGVKSQIIQAMSHLTSQEAGLTIGAKCYVNGSRQGNVMLYKFDQYPVGAVSPVSFLWQQQMKTDTPAATNAEREKQNIDNSKDMEGDILKKETNSQLWVWAHPASFHSVFDAISAACSSVGRTSVKRDSKFSEGLKTDCIDKPEQSDQGKNLHSPTNNDIEHSELAVISHQFDLLRFRLTGPQSHALLASTLTLPASSSNKDPSDTIIKRDSTFLCKDSSCRNSSKWWHKSANDSLPQNVLWDRLKQASSPSVLPPWCVIGLTVLDPRLDLPVKKTSIANATEGITSEEPFLDEDEAVGNSCKMKDKSPSFEHVLTHWPANVAGSHIWDESVRLEVKETKIPEQELNRRRSELLVPGSQLELSEDEISHVPLLLIQQPGCSDTSRDTGVSVGYGSGWDIILPSGWAMAFWMALVYRGARTGGLQESQTLALEQGVPFFPNDFPDTPAGEAYNAKLKDDGEAEYRRYPPAKRPNYEKLGSKCPFSPPWRELVNDWNSSSSVTGLGNKTTSDAISTKIFARDSTQIDDSVVQPLSLAFISRDSPTENTAGTVDLTRISSESIAHTKANAIASNSSQMDDSVSEPVSVPVPTENTSGSTKTDTVAGESAQMVSSIVQPLYVLRSRSKLSTFRSYVARYKQRQSGGSKHQKMVNKPPASLDDFDLSSIVRSDPNSLVCVLLRMVNRSVPVLNSAVAIPSTGDTSRLKKCRDFAGPLEPLHKGPKALCKSLRNSCTREIVGFVSSGHYSLSRGCGFGIAFCALPGLVKLLSSSSSTGELVVLVRGSSTQQYRFAYLTIL